MKKSQLITIILAIGISIALQAQDYNSITDIRDGKKYKTVKIGNHLWMAENLNYETKTGSSAYNFEEKFINHYSQLYNWKTARSACPQGWHLPSIDEWNQLLMNIGVEKSEFNDELAWIMSDIGFKLIAKNQLWDIEESDFRLYEYKKYLNISGFSALPGGYRYMGKFEREGLEAGFWTNSPNSDISVIMIGINYRGEIQQTPSLIMNDDLNSVRCIKDGSH